MHVHMFTFTGDYVEMANFTACEHRKCVSLSIVDDSIVERVESFYITLERTPDLNERINFDLAAVQGVVNIIDDDGENNT